MGPLKNLLLNGFISTLTIAGNGQTELDLLDIQYQTDLRRLVEIEKKIQGLEDLLTTSSRSTVVSPIINGRLSLESGVAISTANQTGKTTLYFVPFNGNRVTLYSGTVWTVHTFSQLSLSLGTLSDATNYDVFLHNNAGTLTLSLTAWTDATNRATAIVLQDGVYVKSGSATHRYLGTLRTTSATTTEDSSSKRFVWNYYNRVPRFMAVSDSTDSWTAGALGPANGNSDNKLDYVVGVNEVLVKAYSRISGWNTEYQAGIGLSSTSVNSAQIGTPNVTATNFSDAAYGTYYGYPGVGYQYLTWLVYGNSSTVYGDAGTTRMQNGMIASIEG